ncbi:MAG: hypothetical protein ACI9CF_000129 [Candidatus Omnitrophota bacterium]|jgi:hypothetical protein
MTHRHPEERVVMATRHPEERVVMTTRHPEERVASDVRIQQQSFNLKSFHCYAWDPAARVL